MQTTYERLIVDERSLFHFQEFKLKRFASPFHLHDEFELILIKKSHGKLYIGNSVTNFTDGDVFLFAPGVPHCFINTRNYEKGGILAHAIVIQFAYNFLGENFFEKTESFYLKNLINLSKLGIKCNNPTKKLISRIEKINKLHNLQRLGSFLFILSELARSKEYTLLTSAHVIPDLPESKVINDVIRYVAENFQEGLSLGKAAEIANMQKSAFCRYFKRRTKKKFMEFVNETRIIHAQKLLSDTDKNIIEIAYECGYESSSYFYRLFKQYNNISPITFRKQTQMRNSLNKK